jgi:hypothetical protein
MDLNHQSIVVEEHVIGMACGEINRLGGVIQSLEATQDGKKEIAFDLPLSAQREFDQILGHIREQESVKPDSEAKYCSFCGKEKREVKNLVQAPGGSVFICNECILVSMELISKDDGS